MRQGEDLLAIGEDHASHPLWKSELVRPKAFENSSHEFMTFVQNFV